MKFKKIYIEITNVCNLSCSFCNSSNRVKKEMTPSEFEVVLKHIGNYTEYIYLHVKGEPLLHKQLDKILFLTKKYNKRVCITTNGVFLKEKLDILNKYDNIYQINISLHSENNKRNYLEDILYSIDNLIYPYISLRFWTLDMGKMNSETKRYLNVIRDRYKVEEIKNHIKLKEKVFLSLEDKFEWPNINNDYTTEGYCLGGKKHIAILSDGTTAVCCLDSDGASNLGNIFSSTLEEILHTEKYKNIVSYFQKRKCYLEICKHCSYKKRFENDRW